jgi:hypothetical protein
MNRLAACVAISLFTAVPSIAHAIVIRHDRTEQQSLALAADSHLPPVGHLDESVGCTLIAPDWVISAAHVLEDAGPFDDHFVTLSGARYPVVKIIVNPLRIAGAVDPEHDLVLLKLGRTVTGVAPVPLLREPTEFGDTVLIAGYGRIGTGLTGPVGERMKTLHAATNRVDSVSARAIFYHFDPPPGGTDMEGVGGGGDSGSPAFVKRGGRWMLAGVTCMNSGDAGQAAHYGTFSGAARMSAHAGWIDSTIAADPPSTVDWSALARLGSWPETPAGRLGAAFVRAWNQGSPEALTAFMTDHALPRPGRTPAQRAATLLELVREYGRYEPWGYKTAGARIAVLVHAASGPWRSLVLENDAVDLERMSSLVMEDVKPPAIVVERETSR